MNAPETVEAPSGTALVARTSIVKVEAALAEFDAIEAGLAELRSKYAGVVFDVKSAAGMKEATSARAEVREPRYKTEHARKAGKAPVLTLGRNIEERAAYITEELLKIETPIDEQIKSEEARKEAEREAKIKAEQERVEKIIAAIDEIKRYAIEAFGQSAANIATCMESLEREQIDERFGEFKPEAEQAKVAAMNRLNTMHAAAVEHEAEQARIKAEREELEKQKAEQIERARQENALIEEGIQRRLAEDQAARDKLQAEEAASKARIDAQERAAAELRAKADAEAMALRIADETRLRSIREAEEKRIVAEREKLERERLAKEKRDKEAADKIEAKAKAKRDKEEAAERARLLKEQERMDARQMLEAFVTRYGTLPEFAGVVEAIEACLSKETA